MPAQELFHDRADEGEGRHVRNAGETEARAISSPAVRPVRLYPPCHLRLNTESISARSSKDGGMAWRRHDERIQREPRVIALR